MTLAFIRVGLNGRLLRLVSGEQRKPQKGSEVVMGDPPSQKVVCGWELKIPGCPEKEIAHALKLRGQE